MNAPLCYKSQGRFFFPKDKIPKKNVVMNKLGVENNTFAGNMISRLYDYYFKDATNFRKEYKKYYSKEFPTIEQYIEEHFNIEPNLAEKYARDNYCIKECSRRTVERNVTTLNMDSEFKSLFAETVGGIDDEDKNGLYY